MNLLLLALALVPPATPIGVDVNITLGEYRIEGTFDIGLGLPDAVADKATEPVEPQQAHGPHPANRADRAEPYRYIAPEGEHIVAVPAEHVVPVVKRGLGDGEVEKRETDAEPWFNILPLWSPALQGSSGPAEDSKRFNAHPEPGQLDNLDGCCGRPPGPKRRADDPPSPVHEKRTCPEIDPTACKSVNKPDGEEGPGIEITYNILGLSGEVEVQEDIEVEVESGGTRIVGVDLFDSNNDNTGSKPARRRLFPRDDDAGPGFEITYDILGLSGEVEVQDDVEVEVQSGEHRIIDVDALDSNNDNHINKRSVHSGILPRDGEEDGFGEGGSGPEINVVLPVGEVEVELQEDVEIEVTTGLAAVDIEIGDNNGNVDTEPERKRAVKRSAAHGAAVGCNAGQMRCTREGTCLPSTAKCCRDGKTYCPEGFYCINNGQSCCLIGKWCPLFMSGVMKRAAKDGEAMEARSSFADEWAFSLAMDFHL